MLRQDRWPTTKAQLLSQMRDSRNNTAWHRFVDLYLPLIYRYSRSRGLQDSDAQDVAQDVLLRVNRAMRSFQYNPQRGKFRHWLGLITRQRILVHLQKQQGAVRGMGGGAGDAICDNVAYEVDGQWIEAFNARVYECARAEVRAECDTQSWYAFERVFECGCRPQDVALSMQRSPEWVYQAKFRILQRIKQLVCELSVE